MLTNAEVQYMRDSAGETMLDTCIIRTRQAQTTDLFGYDRPAFRDSLPLRCGMHTPSAREVMGTAEVTVETVVLVVPFAFDDGTPVALTAQDQITLTHRMGIALAHPQTYAIKKGPTAGSTCWMLELTKVG